MGCKAPADLQTAAVASPRWLRACCIALAVSACLSSQARAELVTVPQEGSYVVDRAGLLDAATLERMERWCKELEVETPNHDQVKVLTVPTVGDEDFFEFSQRHYTLWKLGQKGKNNGALIVLAVQERKVRVHTGYGLEGALPDSWSGSACRQVAGRYFKFGKFSEGLLELTVAVVQKVATEEDIVLKDLPEARLNQPAAGNSPGGAGMLVLFFIVIVIFSFIQRGRGYRRTWGGGIWQGMILGNLLGDIGRSSGGGWSSGGGAGGGWGGGSSGGSWGGGGESGGGGGGASW